MKQSSNQAVRFVVFADTQRFLRARIDNNVVCDFTAGGFAGFCSTMANNPVDVIKTKMQQKDAAGKSFAEQARLVYASRGFMGFYSGVVPRLARVVLDAALTFSIFHGLKRKVINYLESR